MTIRDGTPILKAIEPLLERKNLIAIGINCSSPIDTLKCLKQIKGITKDKIRLAAWPNPTEYNNNNNGFIDIDKDPNNLIKLASAFIKLGVTILGGCCGVDPILTAQLAQTVINFGQEISLDPLEHL